MGRAGGYEYCYRVWKEDEIIPQYNRRMSLFKSYGPKRWLFEIRTNFKLKSRDDDGEDPVMIGSEMFGAVVLEDAGERALKEHVRTRLKDYWMCDDEIQSLVHDAFDFARERGADASESGNPVVVGLDVCTVQQEGEPIIAAIDRAIKPECLLPLHLCYVAKRDSYPQVNEKRYLFRKNLLMQLPRIRVEDEAGLAVMEVCPVCSHNSVIGAQITFLPCNHACHSLCVFRWLDEGKGKCPLCGVLLPSDFDSDSDSDLEI